jgi:hypothetical protein
MSRVVYVLGAGFSAPLGLPVIRNFLIKSKDLHALDSGRFCHFQHVFEIIGRMAVCKNYFDCDLFNIEEILSIVEMEKFVQSEEWGSLFNKYISDVIDNYTPNFYPSQGSMDSQNWKQKIIGGNSLHRAYGIFAGNLLGVQIKHDVKTDYGEPKHIFSMSENSEPTVNYSVVTLNYDMVLENTRKMIRSEVKGSELFKFRRPDEQTNGGKSLLAKLHGSTDHGNIVPPTWAKGTHRNISTVWREAFEVLTNANCIRFLGYSLPLSDSYIKYILKAAMVGSGHLKQIDVICKDVDGSVEERYRQFVHFQFFRFKNGDVQDYLKRIERAHLNNNFRNLLLNNVEAEHESFMAN